MRSLLLALLIVFAASRAQAQGDLDLVTSVIPPNVMLLLDNSGSMAHAMWPGAFVPEVFHDTGAVLTDCDIGPVPAQAGSGGFCPGSGDALNRCPDSGNSLNSGTVVSCSDTAIPGGCAAAPAGWSCGTAAGQLRFTLPEFTAGSTRTRWSKNYLSWLFSEIINGTTPAIPMIDRLDTARDALLELIDLINPDGFNENVRFGLAKFDSGNDPDGGVIDAPVQTGNKNALIARINNVSPGGWTPLAETLVDIGEYMSGDDSVGDCTAAGNIGNSNPMQDGPCRKNFVIVLTDGEPSKDDFDHPPGGTAGFMCAIGNADGDTNELPDEFSGRTDMPPYQALGTDWLDDVAYQFYENDLRPDLPGPQNMVTYTVGFTFDHPLLRDTATNSTGKYYIARNASELAATLEAALLDILERAASFTATTVPSSRTAFGDGMFSAWFIPRVSRGLWEGHLEAYRLSSALEVLDRDGDPAIDATDTFIAPRNPFWDVYETLRSPFHPARAIYTTQGGVRTGFNTGTINAADLALSPGELGLYPNDPAVPFPDTEALADGLVDFLYGKDAFDFDRDLDTAELRDWVLGDIFHSNPLVIGPPPPGLRGEEGYGPVGQPGTFLDLYKERSRRLYVGANDGMLHAIEAGDFNPGDNPATPETEFGYYDLGSGNEDFAYVPGFLLDKLKLIPRNFPRAEYYVDGSPTAADAWLASSPTDTTKDTSEWTTVMVTGMRQGGDGYLALDVTDPTALGGAHGPYPKLLWELDDPSLPLGETWSEPIITRVKVKASAGFGDHCGKNALDDGDCREQWVAIFGGGFRAGSDPNMPTYANPADAGWSDDSKAIFVVDLATGQVLAQVAYDAADPQLSQMVYALPSTPAVLDLDFDGFADVIYIGDAGGQMWKWDISNVADDPSGDGLFDNWPVGIFFRAAGPQAVSGGGLHYRSIFFAPVVTFLEGELVLGFATGERTDIDYPGDPSRDDNNRFYVITDPTPIGAGSIPLVAYSESDLTDITGLASDFDQTDLGFYFVAEDGEKFITNHAAFGGVLITTSYLPDDGSGSVCAADGEAFVHIFDISTGQGFFDPATSSHQGRRVNSGLGVPSDPRITVSTSVDGGVKILLKSSAGQLITIDAPDLVPEAVGLVYWRQRF
ncbi:MAG: PilC/PilY family type IV pilus protein [Myxococcota bacterium]